MAKKRILFVVEAMGGGVFTYIVDLANELVNNYDMYIAYAVGLPVKYLIIRHNDRYLGISDLQGNICFTLDKPDISNIEYFAEDKFLVEKYDKTCHIITISESEDK